MARKDIFSNGIWSVLAMALYQGVLQFAVYPVINNFLGAEVLGNILYIVALLTVLAPAVGNAIGNTRVVIGRDDAFQNGDFTFSLIIQMIILSSIFLILSANYIDNLKSALLLLITFYLTTVRCYGESEYKILFNFRGYFFYFLLLSVGSVFGLCIFFVTKNWIWAFLFGELLCTVLLFIKFNNFHSFGGHAKWRQITTKSLPLSCSYLLSYMTAFLDRILIQQLLSGTAVSIYYVSSLFGKLIMLLADPISGILLSYISKFKVKVSVRIYWITLLIAAGVGLVFYGCVMIFSPIFINLLYPELYHSAIQILWSVGISQVFSASTAILMTILLNECGTKWQFYFQLLYFVQYLLISVIGIEFWGISGFSVCGAISNMIQLLIVAIGGAKLIKKNSISEEYK